MAAPQSRVESIWFSSFHSRWRVLRVRAAVENLYHYYRTCTCTCTCNGWYVFPLCVRCSVRPGWYLMRDSTCNVDCRLLRFTREQSSSSPSSQLGNYGRVAASSGSRTRGHFYLSIYLFRPRWSQAARKRRTYCPRDRAQSVVQISTREQHPSLPSSASARQCFAAAYRGVPNLVYLYRVWTGQLY